MEIENWKFIIIHEDLKSKELLPYLDFEIRGSAGLGGLTLIGPFFMGYEILIRDRPVYLMGQIRFGPVG